MPIDTYRTQKRGGRGVQAANLKEEDALAHLFVATTTHYILFFTDRGRVYRLKAYEVPQTSRQARGQHINNFIQVEPGDKITAILPMKDMSVGGYLLLATEFGEVKRTALAEFANLRVNGKKCFDIEEGDNLRWVRHTDGEQEMIMVTRRACRSVSGERVPEQRPHRRRRARHRDARPQDERYSKTASSRWMSSARPANCSSAAPTDTASAPTSRTIARSRAADAA